MRKRSSKKKPDVNQVAKFIVDTVSGEGSSGESGSKVIKKTSKNPAAVALGRTLGLTIIAEGIEEAGQLDRLRELGCQLGQGYLLGRPVPSDDLEALLRQSAAAADAVEAAERLKPIRVDWPPLPEAVELAQTPG